MINPDASYKVRGAGKEPPLAASRGYTLIELIVATGLFAVVMLLSSGAYLIMISANKQAQSISSGMTNISFALETMTRSIRTGTHYQTLSGSNSFNFTDSSGVSVTYALGSASNGNGDITITKNDGSAPSVLTDPAVNITSLVFFVYGALSLSSPGGDYLQPRVTILVSGTVNNQSFHVETGATMRGSDL